MRRMDIAELPKFTDGFATWLHVCFCIVSGFDFHSSATNMTPHIDRTPPSVRSCQNFDQSVTFVTFPCQNMWLDRRWVRSKWTLLTQQFLRNHVSGSFRIFSHHTKYGLVNLRRKVVSGHHFPIIFPSYTIWMNPSMLCLPRQSSLIFSHQLWKWWWFWWKSGASQISIRDYANINY